VQADRRGRSREKSAPVEAVRKQISVHCHNFPLHLISSIDFFHEDVCKLDWVAVVLQGDWPTGGYAGQLRIPNDGFAVQVHAKPVAAHGDYETIPLADWGIQESVVIASCCSFDYLSFKW